jgi:hypothetical protein
MKGVIWFMVIGLMILIMQIGSVYLIRAEGALFLLPFLVISAEICLIYQERFANSIFNEAAFIIS